MSAAVAQAIRSMMAAGLTLDQALLAVEKMDEAKRGSAKSNAERQAAWRARQKAETRNDRNERNVTSVTPPSLKDPLPNLETVEVNPNPPPYSPPALEKPDLGFDEIWRAYPRRQGGNSRKNAEASFRKSVKSGFDASAILAGVLAYAAHCDATGKTGTEFVKTAEAWLNGRFWESDWSISQSRPAPPHRQAPNRRSLIDAIDRMIPDEPVHHQHFPRLAYGG